MNDVLSKDAIEELLDDAHVALRPRAFFETSKPVTLERHAHTIIALIADRERLVAVAEVAEARCCADLKCSKCGELQRRLGAWKAAVKP